ncbi:MAG: histidine--tRNA ligase, partial [Oscillospiraceae bacterium]|nr:histidine--tRNA ligase [Oscillospiraceae bacterium]
GRYREFSQFGVECFGAATPAADAEMVSLVAEYFAAIGLENYRIELNSIGCPECRKVYLEKLREYFDGHTATLCGTCHDRLAKNPMRILDCKSPKCGDIATQAPATIEHLCGDCDAHFAQVQQLLWSIDIPFTLNSRMVRGLDYYTHTVVEFVSEQAETAGLVLGGGGRYDGLIEQLGGAHTPSCGFALGLERILLHLQAANTPLPERENCELYIATQGEHAHAAAFNLAAQLRAEGIATQLDIVGRSLKAQMKFADKIGANYTCVLGDSELESAAVRLKNMQTGTQHAFKLTDLAEEFAHFLVQQAHEELTALYEN